MIGLDTNVLVRIVTLDDPGQAVRARGFLERCTVENPGWISAVVLCELVWALQRAYRYSREQVAEVLLTLLQAEDFRIEDGDLARQAFERFSTSRCDYSDALIGLRNEQAGASPTYTFDKGAAAIPGFALID